MSPKLYNFDQDEIACSQSFDKHLSRDSELLSRLFHHLEALIGQLNGKIKGSEFPDWTIEIFLANNLNLLYNSYDRLRKGYVGISEALLRPVIESIALSMYFFEFPEDEKKYRKDPKSFYAKLKALGYPNWIEGVAHRVDKEGTKFSKGDPAKGQSWYNFLVRNLGDEASNFLHANPDYIFSVLFGSKESTHDNYVLGPNWPGIDGVKTVLWHIIEATLFNTIVFDRCFKQHISINDFSLIKETVGRLNKWKEEYQKIVKRKGVK